MPHSHHSHSGQFCGHAVSTLEEVVQRAIEHKLDTFCMTEHMPREEIDFYPEEATKHTAESLVKLYNDFYHEARRLQKAYAGQIQLFVGFEAEWIRPSSLQLIKTVLEKYQVDIFVGSVHHVHTIPIDYDHDMYYEARKIAGGSDQRIFEDYFDSQYEMLQALKPPLVGHFDLIRLKSDQPDQSFRTWPSVWSRIERNLRYIAEYGGIVELNSSSLRKGMQEAYPQTEICKVFREMGGRFALSDDSHGIAQVAANYHRVWSKNIMPGGITELSRLVAKPDTEAAKDQRFPTVAWEPVPVESLQTHALFLRTE